MIFSPGRGLTRAANRAAATLTATDDEDEDQTATWERVPPVASIDIDVGFDT